ncbi:MAG: anti-sigma factor, partial [Chloroflexota bacterium]
MTDLPKMDDSTLFDLLPAYALDALSEEERKQVEAFLAGSEAARAELRTYEAMLTGFATLVPAQQVPAYLTDDFRKRLAASTPPASSTTSFLSISRRPWILAIAAVFIVAIVGVALYGTRDQREIASILSDSAAQRVELEAQPGTTGKVTLVMRSNSTRAVLVAEQVSVLPDEKQYQLWMIRNTDRDSAEVFSIDQPHEELLVSLPDPASEYE